MEQQNDLVAGQAAELERLERRQRTTREKLAAVQASEIALVRAKHQRELAMLWFAQGRQLGPGMQRILDTGGRNGSAR